MKENNNNPKTEPDSNDELAAKNVESTTEESLVFVIFFYLIIGVIVVWISKTVQNFLLNNILPIGIILTIIVLGSIIYLWTNSKESKGSVKRKIAIISYGAIPILLALVVAILILPHYHIVILRSFFLLIVCLLPATLYYLFIASSKSSLLHEYFTNLSRLGLLERQSLRGDENESESELVRRVRVMSYVEKFEAVYGSIPEDLAGEIISATDPDNKNAQVPAFHKYSTEKMLGGIFTPETTIPVVLATLLIGLGWLLTLPPWAAFDNLSESSGLENMALALKPAEYTVNFAFLGAYFFSLQMLFRRYLRKDLRGNAYTAVSLRIILAIIGIWALIQAVPILDNIPFIGVNPIQDPANQGAMLVIGFVVGAFPPVIWQIIQSAFLTLTGARFFVPSIRSEMPVNQLDGLTVWHEARLEEEDIENVPNMATTDIVELMLHTRIPPERIMDWVDQAILYTLVGPEKKVKNSTDEENIITNQDSYRMKLRRHGIRTASDLIVAYYKCNHQKDIESFEKILPKEGRHCVQSMVDVLSTYPNVKLVLRWRFLNSYHKSVMNIQQKTGAPHGTKKFSKI